jgi:site-specific recombinase XerD
VKSFALHFHRSPAELADQEIREYLHYLIQEKKVSQSLISQAYSALKFFYETTLRRDWNGFRIPRAKTGRKLPVVLSLQEIQAILSATRNLKHRALLMTIYSAGLRVSEVVHLKEKGLEKALGSVGSEKALGSNLQISIDNYFKLNRIQVWRDN